MRRCVGMARVGIAILGFFSGVVLVRADVPDPATVAAAKTPTDHEAIAKAYEQEASSLQRMADMHKYLADTYAQPGGKPWQAAQAKHCKAVASELAAAARNERALAEEHHKMAKGAER